MTQPSTTPIRLGEYDFITTATSDISPIWGMPVDVTRLEIPAVMRALDEATLHDVIEALWPYLGLSIAQFRLIQIEKQLGQEFAVLQNELREVDEALVLHESEQLALRHHFELWASEGTILLPVAEGFFREIVAMHVEALAHALDARKKMRQILAEKAGVLVERITIRSEISDNREFQTLIRARLEPAESQAQFSALYLWLRERLEESGIAIKPYFYPLCDAGEILIDAPYARVISQLDS